LARDDANDYLQSGGWEDAMPDTDGLSGNGREDERHSPSHEEGVFPYFSEITGSIGAGMYPVRVE
jgi:hypothetical protein